MANGRTRRMAAAAALALLATTAITTLAPSPASACSWMQPTIRVADEAVAGGTLQIRGVGFFTVEGGIGGDCSGDYDFVPREPVTVVVSFETLSGPRSIALVAPVTGPRIPNEEATGGIAEQYTISVETPIPADATSATVEVGWSVLTVVIEGATATTAPTTPSDGGTRPTTPAAPAAAVTGDPSFTG